MTETSADRGYRVLTHGREQQPVVLIDNFLPDAEGLVSAASAREFKQVGPYYPGVRAPARPDALAPARYFSGDTDQFELLAAHEAKFNRAIIYRGITLHSGYIPEGLAFSADPAHGRLTVNTFLQAR